MTENPFASADDSRRYLVLFSGGAPNAAMMQKALRNLQEKIYAKASPLWIDANGIGVFVETTLVAWEIMSAMFEADFANQFANAKDVLVVEIGKDWFARQDAKPEHWLSTHVGPPSPVPPLRARRR